MKADVELLHVVVDQGDLVIGHEPARSTGTHIISRAASWAGADSLAYIFMTSVSIRRLGELCWGEGKGSDPNQAGPFRITARVGDLS